MNLFSCMSDKQSNWQTIGTICFAGSNCWGPLIPPTVKVKTWPPYALALQLAHPLKEYCWGSSNDESHLQWLALGEAALASDCNPGF